MNRKNTITIITSLFFLLTFAYPHLGYAETITFNGYTWGNSYKEGKEIFEPKIDAEASSIGINRTNKAEYKVMLDLIINKYHSHDKILVVDGYTIKFFKNSRTYKIKRNIKVENGSGFQSKHIIGKTGKVALTITIPEQYQDISFDRIEVTVCYSTTNNNKGISRKFITLGMKLGVFTIEKSDKENGKYLIQIKNTSGKDLYIKDVSLATDVITESEPKNTEYIEQIEYIENKNSRPLIVIKNGECHIMRYEILDNSIAKHGDCKEFITIKYKENPESKKVFENTIDFTVNNQGWLSWFWQNFAYYSTTYWYIPVIAGACFGIYLKPNLLMYIPAVAKMVGNAERDAYQIGHDNGFSDANDMFAAS